MFHLSSTHTIARERRELALPFFLLWPDNSRSTIVLFAS
jgi:hypothetical protein